MHVIYRPVRKPPTYNLILQLSDYLLVVSFVQPELHTTGWSETATTLQLHVAGLHTLLLPMLLMNVKVWIQPFSHCPELNVQRHYNNDEPKIINRVISLAVRGHLGQNALIIKPKPPLLMQDSCAPCVTQHFQRRRVLLFGSESSCTCHCVLIEA